MIGDCNNVKKQLTGFRYLYFPMCANPLRKSPPKIDESLACLAVARTSMNPTNRKNQSTLKTSPPEKNDETYAYLAVAQTSENRVPRRRESSQLALRPRKSENIDKSKKLKPFKIKWKFATKSSRVHPASPSLQNARSEVLGNASPARWHSGLGRTGNTTSPRT